MFTKKYIAFSPFKFGFQMQHKLPFLIWFNMLLIWFFLIGLVLYTQLPTRVDQQTIFIETWIQTPLKVFKNKYKYLQLTHNTTFLKYSYYLIISFDIDYDTPCINLYVDNIIKGLNVTGRFVLFSMLHSYESIHFKVYKFKILYWLVKGKILCFILTSNQG